MTGSGRTGLQPVASFAPWPAEAMASFSATAFACRGLRRHRARRGGAPPASGLARRLQARRRDRLRSGCRGPRPWPAMRDRASRAAGALPLSIDAPGPAALHVGLRLPDDDPAPALHGLVPAAAVEFWRRARDAPAGGTMRVSVRGCSGQSNANPSSSTCAIPRRVGARAAAGDSAGGAHRHRLSQVRPPASEARPWVFRCEIQNHSDRPPPRALAARAACAGAKGRGCDRAGLLRHHDASAGTARAPSGVSGRWVIVTPLDEESEPALRIGNTGWLLTAEDDGKQRAIGQLMTSLGGPRDYAEALEFVQGRGGVQLARGSRLRIAGEHRGRCTPCARGCFADVQAYTATADAGSSTRGYHCSMALSAADPSIA